MSGTDLLKMLLPILVGIPTTTVIMIILFVYLFENPKQFEHWGSLFYRFVNWLGGHFRWLQKVVGRQVVAWDVQDSINGASEWMSKQAPGILPHALRIQWVRTATPEAFLANGEVIVRLNKYENQEKNLVNATIAYVSKGLLPRAKQYVEPVLRQATELMIARHILAAEKETGAAEYFIESVIAPKMKENPILEQNAKLLEDISEVGFFTRVFLNEVRELGDLLFPTVPNDKTYTETRNLANFLQVIANKGIGEDVPLNFSGTRLKSTILLVARSEKLISRGLAPYVKALEHSVKNGYASIYVCGLGDEFIDSVKALLNEVGKKRGLIRILRTHQFPTSRPFGNRNNAILAVCQPSNRYLQKVRSITDPIRRILLEKVPEVASGQVEILDIVREPEIGTKVLVRTRDETANPRQAVELCVARMPDIKPRLPGGEWIYFVNWSSSLTDAVIEAISHQSVSKANILSIEINETERTAILVVSDKSTASAIVGVDGSNIRMAEQLVELSIHVEVQPLTPEEVIKRVLARHIPEIANGKVEIIKVARVVGIGSKVLISFAHDEHGDVVQTCTGETEERISNIRDMLNGEWVTLINANANAEEMIISALYPLRDSKIVRFEMNYDRKKCLVVVAGKVMQQRTLGPNGDNLKLACKITEWEIDVKSN